MSIELGPVDRGSTLSESETRNAALSQSNQQLSRANASERVEWALDNLPGVHVLSSSFGIQAAVCLHLLTRQQPDIPVIFTDTGYLFPETYQFVDELVTRLDLNLKVYRSQKSPAWQEARFGQRWDQSEAALAAYNTDNKVEPMKTALRELNAGTWFAGLRRSQSNSRTKTQFLEFHGGRWKVHPIADWSDRQVHRYLTKNNLPYHPLWEQGYVSVGDTHSTQSIHDVDNIDDTRFAGFKRECGLHEIDMAGI
jgi:phosphoadenosine phosphosulfate reductase